jgi:hypothetical protein
MNAPDAPEGRLYAPLAAALGLVLAAMGLALGVQMVAAVVGPFDFVAPPPAGAASLGIWVPASAGSDARSEARRCARAWRAALGERAAVHEPGALEALRSGGPAVLAVADGRALADEEVAALREWVRRGGSAILTGPVAVRGPRGEWRGTGAMARLLGVERVASLPRSASLGLVASRRGPLSAALAPGQRLALEPEEGVPAVDDPAAELRWAGNGSPGSGPPPLGVRGAALRRELGAGRLVWLGAGPERSAAGAAAPGRDFARLAAAAFAWAAREPFAEVLAGEEPARSEGRPPAAASAPGGGGQDPEAGGALEAELRRLGPRRHLLEVTHRGREPLRGGVVRVHLNARVERLAVGRTLLQQEEPRVRFDARAQHVDVRLPELAGRRHLAYTIDLDPAEGAAEGAGRPAQEAGP